MKLSGNKIFLIICFLIVLFVYGQTIFGEFVFDDRIILEYKPFLSDINQLYKTVSISYWAQEAGLYRPITLLTYSLNYIIFGSGSWSFHLINILLYALTGYFIYVFFKKMFSKKIGFWSGLIFLLLPIHTEAIANIIGRAEILALFFSLLFFIELLKKKINLWKLGLWIFLALASKETAIVSGLIALIIILIKKFQIKKYILPGIVSIVSFFIYLFFRFLVLKQYFLNISTTMVENPLLFVDFNQRILTSFKIFYSVYFKKTILGLNLCSDYSYNQISVINRLDLESFVGILIFLFFIILIFVFWKSKPFISLGSSIFIFGFLPVSNILMPIGTIAGERLMYFPSLGICLILAGLFRKKLLILLILILVFYGGISTIRANDWLTEEKIFFSAAKCAPNSVLSRSNLGAIYYLKGDLENAEKEFLIANDIYDNYSKGVNNLGLIYWKKGNIEKAKELFLKALDSEFPYHGAYENLGLISLEQENYDEAKKWLLLFYNDEEFVNKYIEMFK